MKAGNVSQTIWKRSVKKQLHTDRKEVLFQPSAEEACSVVRISEGKLAVYAQAEASGDSVRTGIYAAVRALNDLAVHGVEPTALSVQILLTPYAQEEDLKAMTGCLESVCLEAGVQLACVRAEVTSAVARTVIFVTAQGEAAEDALLRPAYALPGQDIVLCGYAGLEGMLRILDEREEELGRRFVSAFIQQMKQLRGNVLALDAARAAAACGVKAMYQVGSGGIFAGLWELAEAAGIGLDVELSGMSVRQETVELCEYYNLNPYQMTSAGCILMTARDGDALVKALERVGARAGKLGVTTDKKARVITSGEEQRYLDRPAPDELMCWWERTGGTNCRPV